jgi:hypothetical protein
MRWKDKFIILIVVAVIITIFYGGLTTWAIIKRGAPKTIGVFLVYAWGYFCVLLGWMMPYISWKFEKPKQR